MGIPFLHSASAFNVTMVKVSISLPNNTQITFESDEAEVLREIVDMALRDLPRDLMQVPAASTGPTTDETVEKSTSAAGSALSVAATPPEPAAVTEYPAVEPPAVPTPEPPPIAAPIASPEPSAVEPTAEAAPIASPEPTAVEAAPIASPEPSRESNDGNGSGQGSTEMPTEFLAEEGRRGFVAFCQETNPLGDMRRVVVAAEGASRHFGSGGVNADDLGWLFDMAGWRRPGNFTQTLRNAARSKFGWLERIPGRSGRYAATALGLSKTLSS